MEVTISNAEEFKCEKCKEKTEFKGSYENALKKLCPYCATEEVVEIVNHE